MNAFIQLSDWNLRIEVSSRAKHNSGRVVWNDGGLSVPISRAHELIIAGRISEQIR